MRDVKITSISYNLAGDADGTVPTISVELKFKKVTWCYHVINGSNMNLFNVSYEYDVTKRKKPVSFSLGSMINPFA
jgi:type VI protein secretion system component Hcp